jgi:copper chaperone CopZ
MATNRSTAVLEVSGVQWASSKNVTEAVLSRRPGVLQVDANPVSQTATVTYDPSQTSVAELAKWVRDCGYYCAGQSVPDHICDPLAEPPALLEKHDHHHTTQHTSLSLPVIRLRRLQRPKFIMLVMRRNDMRVIMPRTQR